MTPHGRSIALAVHASSSAVCGGLCLAETAQTCGSVSAPRGAALQQTQVTVVTVVTKPRQNSVTCFRLALNLEQLHVLERCDFNNMTN